MGDQALDVADRAAAGEAPAADGRAALHRLARPRADRAAAAVRAGPARPAAPLLPDRELAAARARRGRCSPWRWRSPARRRSPSPAIRPRPDPRRRLLARLSDRHRPPRSTPRRSPPPCRPAADRAGRPSGPGCAPPSGCSSWRSAARLCFIAPGARDLLPAAAARRRARHGRASAGGPAPSRRARSPRRVLLFLTFGPALALFEELMSSGPPWIFAPLGAAILLPALIELRPLAVAPADPVRGRRRARPRHHGAGSSPPSPPPTAPTGSSSSPSNMSGTRPPARPASRSTMTARRCPMPADWQRTELPYTTRRRWAAPAPAVAGRRTDRRAGRPASPCPGGLRVRLRLRMNGAESVALIAPAGDAAGGGRRRASCGRSARARATAAPSCAASAAPATARCSTWSSTAPSRSISPSSAPAAGLPPAGGAAGRGRGRQLRAAQYGPDSTITHRPRMRLHRELQANRPAWPTFSRPTRRSPRARAAGRECAARRPAAAARLDEVVGQEHLTGAGRRDRPDGRGGQARLDDPVGAARHRQDHDRAAARRRGRHALRRHLGGLLGRRRPEEGVRRGARALPRSAARPCCSWTRSTASTAPSRTASCPMSRTAPWCWSARPPRIRASSSTPPCSPRPGADPQPARRGGARQTARPRRGADGRARCR